MAKTFQASVGEAPQAIERQRALAQTLAQQSMTPEQMQMVSGRVVPYHPIQGLTKLAQALLSRKIDEEADAKEERIKQAQQAKVMGWVQGMPQGTPEMETEGPARPGEAMATTAAVAPSKQSQMAWALQGMASPGTAGIAAPFLAQMMKTPEGFTLGKDQVRFEGGQQVAAGPKGMDEVKAPTTRQVPMGKEVVSQEFDPLTKTWKEVGRGEKGALVENKIDMKGDSEFKKIMGKQAAERIDKGFTESKAASEQIIALHDARNALESGTYAGKGADAKLDAVKFVNAFTGAGIDPETVKNTENLRSSLGSTLLSKAKSLGVNPTDSDVKRLDGILGSIGSDPNALRKLIEFNETISRRSIQNHNRYVKGNRLLDDAEKSDWMVEEPAAWKMPEKPASETGGFKIRRLP